MLIQEILQRNRDNAKAAAPYTSTRENHEDARITRRFIESIRKRGAGDSTSFDTRSWDRAWVYSLLYRIPKSTAMMVFVLKTRLIQCSGGKKKKKENPNATYVLQGTSWLRPCIELVQAEMAEGGEAVVDQIHGLASLGWRI